MAGQAGECGGGRGTGQSNKHQRVGHRLGNRRRETLRPAHQAWVLRVRLEGDQPIVGHPVEHILVPGLQDGEACREAARCVGPRQGST